MLVAHVSIRATRDIQPLPGEPRSDMALDELRILAEELQRHAAVAGWELKIESAIEARCVYERAMLWEPNERPRNERCPETATEVVGGSPYCLSHAKGAHRLIGALEGRPS